MDIKFDGEAGKEILRRLSLSKRRFPVVVLVDYDYPVGDVPSLSRIKVLTKPVPADQLASAVHAVLSKKK